MKKTLLRVASAALCLVLCVTALYVAPVSAQTTAQPIMAFVPLDNRPVCVDRIQYQAASAGFDVRMPDEELYTTRLDGQGGNISPYGCQVGDGASIMTWLEAMDADGCNYYVIHLDQMFSGGLVGSRYPDQNYLTDTERNIMDRLIALSNDTTNHVYFVDTVMRLASTGSFKGYEVTEYSSFRHYAAQLRKELPTTGYYTSDYDASVGQLDTIEANYQIGTDDSTLGFITTSMLDQPDGKYSSAYYAGLTQSQIDTYHGSRRRKMDLINLMMQYGNRNVTYIIGVDDASPQFTIQGNEINFIRARMETLGYTYYLSADTDSSGMMAVARCVTDYYGQNGDNRIPVKVRYYGSQVDVAADDYDIGTLRSNVTTHLESANCYVTEENGEIEVLVLTKNDANYTIQSAIKANSEGTLSDTDLQTQLTRYQNSINTLVAQAKANIAANKPTIIIEASTEGNYLMSWVKGYTNLQDELLENVEISKLLGYSNWNTVGNSIGIAIGQGVARYAYLKNETSISPASHVAFTQAMTFAYVKDITYNARNKHQNFTWTFQYWITNYAGGSGWNNGNFYQSMIAYDEENAVQPWESCYGEHYVNNELNWCMMRSGDATAYNGCGQQVLNAMMAGEVYTDLGGKITTAGVGTITLSRFRCPWFRQFEITFAIDATVEHYAKDASYITQIPTMHSFADFSYNAALQYSATSVTVENLTGTAISSSDLVGTGYTVSMTVGGTTSSYAAVVWGDIDGNAMIDTSDVRQCLLAVLGAQTLSGAKFEAADYDGNNRIASTDARQILQTAIMTERA